MNDIKEGVRAYLERESGIHAVCAPARHTGEYPLLTVDAREDGAVLCAGGAQAEHRYRVSIRCAGDRERSDKNGRLAALVPVLLRGIPMALPSGVPGGGKVRRVLSPQGLETEREACRPRRTAAARAAKRCRCCIGTKATDLITGGETEMGLPEIYISFETAAVSAVKRSSRGVVALAVTDATKGGAASAVYRSLSEVDESKFTKENYRVLSLCFQAGPSKVAVLRIGSDEADTFTALDTLDFDYLAAPGLTQAKVISYIKAERAKGRGVKAVVANATAPDDEGIINFCAEDIVLTDGAVTADNYAARIAGLLAAMPLTRSATYAKLSEVVSCGAQSDADAAIDAGKLILVPNGEGYCLGRAVNSLTTVTTAHGAAFRKIKIVDGVDLIRADITRTFREGYIGSVLNDYDNKLLLVTAINAYFKALEGDVLDKTADNACRVSLSGQRGWLESHGTDTSEMSDAEILRANTGSEVFLEASLTFCDAMEDLTLRIAM